MTALKISGYQPHLGAINGRSALNELAKKTSVAPASAAAKAEKPETFAAQLANATEAQSAAVKFSKHALQRLHSRNVEVTPELLDKLSSAMDKAGAKGARETLVLGDDSAYVVSPQNRTVITAFDRHNLREGVFTSIDSAVIL
ncbi:MAG TPA: TIGR02530 family flagellar biosynthesis protein [candidate division Zixibacteria bacterium]|nr:TIGR02530 family flagellar biosynthesis protein [candidate division Zixibacteria bacterium]